MILPIILSLIAACLIHEAGHFIVALIFGETLRFHFAWGKLFGKIPVPRFIWEMPKSFTSGQKMITGLAGFGAEFLTAIPLCIIYGCWQYAAVVLLHLATYNYYADEANDFKWLYTDE